MAAVPAFSGAAAGVVPAGTGGLHGALDPPSSGWSGTDGVESCATHTKGVGSDEPEVAPRHQRYHRYDRASDHRGDLGWRAQPTDVGETARRADQSQRTHECKIFGRGLPTRSPGHARTISLHVPH